MAGGKGGVVFLSFSINGSVWRMILSVQLLLAFGMFAQTAELKGYNGSRNGDGFMRLSRRQVVHVLLFALSSFVALAQPPVIRLKPLGVFDLPVSASWKLIDFSSNQHGLYFLLDTDAGLSSVSVVVHTGEQGNLVKSTPLSAGFRSQRIRAGGDGKVAVQIREAGKSSLLILDQAGGFDRMLTLPVTKYPPIDYAVLGTSVVAAMPGSLYELLLDEKALPSVWSLFPLAIEPPLRIFSLPGARVLTVGLMSASIQVTRLRAGQVLPPAALSAPEIQAASQPSGPSPIGRVAVSPSGEIYCIAGGHPLREGAAVVQFDSHGRLLSRLRCSLPAISWAAGGYLFPSFIEVVGNYLFIADRQTRRIAYYQLP